MTSHIAFTDEDGDLHVAPRDAMVLTSCKEEQTCSVSICLFDKEGCYRVTTDEYNRLAKVLQT